MSSNRLFYHHHGGDPLRRSTHHEGLIEDCLDAGCRQFCVGRPITETCMHNLRATTWGVGPDSPIEVLENGAKQSRIPYAMTSIDPRVWLRLAAVHAQGDAKYGKNNWRGIPIDDHLNHALTHLLAHLAGDRSDDHLTHALCRVEMALALDIRQHDEDEE